MEQKIHKIFSIYGGIVTYILHLEKYPESFTNFDRLKKDIESLLENCIKELKRIDKNNFMNFLFPLIAFIDEKILLSDWSLKKLWIRNMLQKQYFNTLTCGDLFFNNLEAFDDKKDQAYKLAYIYFLNLGFKGKYYNFKTYEFEELLRINREYFQSKFIIKPNDLFSNSYCLTTVGSPKKNQLFFKSIFLFSMVCSVFTVYFLYLNQDLEQKLQLFQNDLDSKVISPLSSSQHLENNSLFKSFHKSVIKVPKVSKSVDQKLISIFNKPNIKYNSDLREATILVTSDSFTKTSVNQRDILYKTLESFSKPLVEIMQNNSNISLVKLYSYTSSEYRGYSNKNQQIQANTILSQKRANKLQEYFIQKAKNNNLDTNILQNKFAPIGKGSRNIIYNQDGSENKILSRRIVIKIIRTTNEMWDDK